MSECCDWEFHSSKGILLDSTPIGSHKCKLLSFVGLGEFNVWLVQRLVIEEKRGFLISVGAFCTVFTVF